ncbi:glycoside hydrolase family 25 protein [Hymenobacter sp. RP-2-7]|uniref:Glycoside hydrolase family 25 protein n=1 Tax=Hymenobacter polaris TaxID=2682546 RepID=A0A7Y0AH02_9BACT|nr:glycoside hydrolase family 25 protein [Hymenobacter polaris]NML67196.1 glycoside hydrolase family 25 protein [Hymenobacter polaris]
MPELPVSTPALRGAPARPPAPRRPWRQWVLAALLLGLLGGGAYYLRHQRQLNRYARRTWATLTWRYLTGRESTPLLAGYSVHGIDVSAYQGRIDWPQVARQQVRFAFIKASEGGSLRDARFARNWREARAAGVLCGAYHYFQPNRDGAQQAALFIKTVPLRPGDLPPVLDVEAPRFHDVAALRRQVQQWLQAVRAHYGVSPILYTNYAFYRRYLAGHFDEYPLWLAHYEVAQPTLPAERWIIWQHSDEAYVPGIRGTVDFNVFQGSYDELLELRLPAPLAQKEPQPSRH